MTLEDQIALLVGQQTLKIMVLERKLAEMHNKMLHPDEPGGPATDPEDEGQQGGGSPTPQCPSCGQFVGSPGHSCACGDGDED